MNPRTLHYLIKLTTSQGIVQHTSGNRLDLAHGYTLDDNARAIVAVLVNETALTARQSAKLLKTYLDFVKRAQTSNGWFINFFDRRGRPAERRGSEESFGRTVWALSLLTKEKPGSRFGRTARSLLKKSLPKVRELKGMRGLGCALLGAVARGDRRQARWIAHEMTTRLSSGRRKGWPWFEDTLTYSNGLIPLAFAQAGRFLADRQLGRLALQTFEFLDKTCRIKGLPAPIGNKGWYRRGYRRALYDQQPIDAAMMVLAAFACYELTGRRNYLERAIEWFDWFHGDNSKKVSLLNRQTGGIYDGITARGLNRNQGAENTVLYLVAYAALSRYQKIYEY